MTVTRVKPDQLKVGNIQVQNQRMFIPFEARTQKDKTLGFYFNPEDYPTSPDPAMILLPHAQNMPPNYIEDHRIQDAIMTSAAFPGAFGRKRLQYCRLASFIPEDKEDPEMRIIFDGLIKTLESGEKSDTAKKGLFYTENTFFHHLKNENFTPTATDDGTKSLLTQIINDPSRWSSELTRRITTRIVYLERRAEVIYTAREPDPEKRATSFTTLMGISAYSLQTATYKYPDFTFAPSTAPENLAWRNFIPYEVAIDIAESDMIFTWQPSWALSNQNIVNVRASLGFAGGLIESSETKNGKIMLH